MHKRFASLFLPRILLCAAAACYSCLLSTLLVTSPIGTEHQHGTSVLVQQGEEIVGRTS